MEQSLLAPQSPHLRALAWEDMGEPISLSRSKRRFSVPPELLRLPDHARGAEHRIFLDDSDY